MNVRTIKTSPSEKLATEISKWVEEVKERFPAALSPDRTGVMIYGDLGGAAYISADGTIALEPFDQDPGNPWFSDPNIVITVLIAGTRRRPALAELLPQREAADRDCPECHGSGRFLPLNSGICCPRCYGLGWVTKRRLHDEIRRRESR